MKKKSKNCKYFRSIVYPSKSLPVAHQLRIISRLDRDISTLKALFHLRSQKRLTQFEKSSGVCCSRVMSICSICAALSG